MKTLLIYVMLMAAAVSAWPQAPGTVVPAKIEALRKQRETAISAGIVKANADYAAALDKLKTLYGSDAAVAKMIADEKGELAKAAVVILPPVVKIAGPLPGPEAAVKHDKPQIHKPEELERYLIGTRWNYYKNANFFGEPTVLEFTAPGKATMDGKEFAWRVLDKARIGFEDKHEFTFSKNYDEFTGTWIPNPVDKKSARLIQP